MIHRAPVHGQVENLCAFDRCWLRATADFRSFNHNLDANYRGSASAIRRTRGQAPAPTRRAERNSNAPRVNEGRRYLLSQQSLTTDDRGNLGPAYQRPDRRTFERACEPAMQPRRLRRLPAGPTKTPTSRADWMRRRRKPTRARTSRSPYSTRWYGNCGSSCRSE